MRKPRFTQRYLCGHDGREVGIAFRDGLLVCPRCGAVSAPYQHPAPADPPPAWEWETETAAAT